MKNKKSVTEVVREGNTMSLTTTTGKPSKTWDLTINNPTDEDKHWLQNLEVKFISVSLEKGESETLHYQGRITFCRAYRLTQLKKLNPRAHWEIAKCTADSNYTRKADSIIIRHEDNRKQGQRGDLHDLRMRIYNGESAQSLYEEDETRLYQYGRVLDRFEDWYLRTQQRTEMTRGIWYYGPTGTGKSREAFKGYHHTTHYVWRGMDKGWWDGYTGQETVIINDFRGEISYNTMLQLLDRDPFFVPRRGRESIPLLAKRIIITSSLSPERIYCHRDEEDSIKQLLRRIDVIKMS